MSNLVKIEIETIISCIVWMFVACLILLGFFRICSTYSAHYFTEQTGLEAKCNVMLECYVKQDSTWIPYKVWVIKQQENKVDIINTEK